MTIMTITNSPTLSAYQPKKQRMDSTMFMTNIKKNGRLVLAYDMLPEAVKAIPKEMRPSDLKEVFTLEFKTNILTKSSLVKRKESRKSSELLL